MRRINRKFFFISVAIQLIQMLFVYFLYQDIWQLGLGGACLYDSSAGFKVVYIFPFALQLYFLLSDLENDFSVSKLYCLTRFQNMGKWLSSEIARLVRTFFFAFLVVDLVAILFSFCVQETLPFQEMVRFSVFFVLNNTLLWTAFVFIYVLISLKYTSTMIIPLFLAILCVVLYAISWIPQDDALISTIFLLPIAHMFRWRTILACIISAGVGFAYNIIFSLIVRHQMKKSDIFR